MSKPNEFGKSRSHRLFQARKPDNDCKCSDCGMKCNVRTGMESVLVDGIRLCEDCAQDVMDGGHYQVYSCDQWEC